MPDVVLVDTSNEALATCEKHRAHEAPGVLHRAVSLFVSDAQGRILLQRRADTKYHFGGLWSNTCCTHPEPGEQSEDAVRRRAREELGIECDRVKFVGSMIYRAVDTASDLVEHELDEVFVAGTASVPRPDPAEASDVSFVGPSDIAARLRDDVTEYTPWLAPALSIVCPELLPRPADDRLTVVWFRDFPPGPGGQGGGRLSPRVS